MNSVRIFSCRLSGRRLPMPIPPADPTNPAASNLAPHCPEFQVEPSIDHV